MHGHELPCDKAVLIRLEVVKIRRLQSHLDLSM